MTMKKFLLLMTFLSILGQSIAQVGINTRNPQGVFHIDGRSSAATTNPDTGTPSAAQQVDDLLVDINGNVGIGTVSPQAKLDVMGNVIIAGGSPVVDKVLTSDNQGIGSWKDFDRSKGIAVWSITATGLNIPAGAFLIKGTQTISDPQGMGFSAYASATSSAITIPAGTYLIIMDFDVNVREYGKVSITQYGTGTDIHPVYYIEQLNGAAAIHTFAAPTTVDIRTHYRDLNASGITRYSALPYTNATAVSKVWFISLTK